MLRAIIALLLFLGSAILIAASTVPLLILIKEGMSFKSLWSSGASSLVLLCLFLLWCFILKYSDQLFIVLLSLLCTLSCFAIICLYLLILGLMLQNYWQGKQQSRAATITQYQETLINWPNFAYPVGLHLEIILPTPFVTPGKQISGFYAPIFWMGPATNKDKQDLFFNFPSKAIAPTQHSAIGTVLLKGKGTYNPANFSQKNNKVSFDLFPGIIEYIKDSNHFCIYSNTPTQVYRPLNQYNLGTEINTLWFYAGNTHVDLSTVLTRKVQASSQLQNNPTLWRNIHQQFEPGNLLRAGFRTCAIETRQNCFCWD